MLSISTQCKKKGKDLYRYLLVFLFVVSGASVCFAQSNDGRSVSGTVCDESGAPLAGVAVIVKGSFDGTTTDVKGQYELRKVSDKDVLVFTMIGMKSLEKTVGSRSVVDVVMTSDNLALDEVVVTGYQSQRKVDLTGSVASISSDNLMKTNPFSTEQALKGKFAGVQVMNNDGAPGGGITVKIRGASSITAGSAPLYVVDGFPYPISDNPYDSPLSTISPDAIESISILKDVSSTAIYGAQGANGVVLITTKKGSEGMSEVSFKASVGVSSIANEIEMLGAEDYMRAYMRSQVMNQHWENTDFYEEYKNRIWETDPGRFQFYPDFCLRNAVKQNYEVSYRGGTDKIQNATTFSYTNEDGIAINTGFNKFYFQTNTTFKILKNLSLNTNLAFDRGIRTGAFWIEDNLFNEIQTFSPLIPREWTFQDIDDNLYYTGKMDNPWRKLTDIDYQKINDNLSGQAELVWNLHENWFVKGSFGIRIPKSETKHFIPETIQAGYDNGGKATYGTESGLTLRGMGQVGFNKTFNGKHRVSVNAVYEVNTNEYNLYSQDFTHFNTDLGWHGIYAAESGSHVTPPTVEYEKVAMMSGVLMANYSYADKYLFKASLRADASSKFAPSNRWGFFPSGAFAWRVSEESFFKNSGWLSRNVSNLKLRLSYGQVGNDQISSYGYVNTLESGDRYGVFGTTNIPSLYLNRMVNPYVGWETTEEFNGGIDLDMFGGRLNFTMDLYTKTTWDMLLNQHLPMLSGYETVTRNVGSVRNRGFEVSLGGRILETKDILWTASVNFSSNVSKVLSLGNDDMMLESRDVGSASSSENVLIKEGLPLGLFYGLQMEGIRSNWYLDNNGVGSTDSSWWYATEREAPYGFPSFVDVNGDGQITIEDRTVIGCVNPKFIGGFNTFFSWRFIDVAMDFSWSYGNDIINGNFYELMNHGDIRNKVASYYKNEWFANNTSGTFTGPGAMDWSGYMWAASTSEMVEDGSFFKMNNLAVTFHLPSSLLNKWRIRDLSLTYSVNNVFCLTNYSGYDPEVSSGSSIDNRILSGVDISSYPYARTHTFTLNFKF